MILHCVYNRGSCGANAVFIFKGNSYCREHFFEIWDKTAEYETYACSGPEDPANVPGDESKEDKGVEMADKDILYIVHNILIYAKWTSLDGDSSNNCMKCAICHRIIWND